MFRIKMPTVTVGSAGKTAATSDVIDNNGNYFFHRRLQSLCKNGRSYQRFSAANAEVLANYLLHYYPQHTSAIRSRHAPSLTSHSKVNTGTSLSLSRLLPPVHEQYFVARDYIETVLNTKVRADAPPPCVLPLPEVTKLHAQQDQGAISKSQLSQMLVARELYHISAAEGYEHYDWKKYDLLAVDGDGVTKAADTTQNDPCRLKTPTEYSTMEHKVTLPRDGLTGNFYQREEVVDNLMAAARHFKYDNPFWLRSTHPQLHKYLKLAAPGTGGAGAATMGSSTDALAGGGKASGGLEYDSYKNDVPCVTVSLSSVIFFLEDLQPKFPVQFLHSHLVPDPNSPHVAGKALTTCYDLMTNKDVIKRGMNASTGFVSSNPYFTTTSTNNNFVTGSHSPSGVWLSLDQVLRYGLTLKDGTKPVVIIDGAPSTSSTVAAGAPPKVAKPKAAKKGKKKAKTDDGADAAPAVPPTPASATATSSPFSNRHMQWTGNGKLVEIEEWELYNAAQLAVPGRVSLNQAAIDESKPSDGLFK